MPIPVDAANKIVQHHLPILNPIRAQLGTALVVSENSGYRPKWWERAKGRAPESSSDDWSQHCFIGKGATDLTCKESALHHLGDLLAESNYARVAWYPDSKFYHCDFKDYQLGKRLFTVQNGIWKEKDYRAL